MTWLEEMTEDRAMAARQVNRMRRCALCLVLLPENAPDRAAYQVLRAPAKNGVRHHVSYWFDLIIPLCEPCHQDAHHAEEVPRPYRAWDSRRKPRPVLPPWLTKEEAEEAHPDYWRQYATGDLWKGRRPHG